MIRKTVMCVIIISTFLCAPMWVSLRVSSEKIQNEITEENPKTGEHPSPLIAGMGLALSGVVISILIDERGRRK